MSLQILTRDVPPRTAWSLEQAGVHPLLSRLFAARGIQSPEELDDGLAKLLPPSTLKGTEAAAVLLADAIAAQKRLCIVADYDCDGATACAVGLRGLRMLGAQHVTYIVPDRVVDGYGLTAPIAQRVQQSGADVLITVDNGIASMDGVAEAQALGLQVLVTDHHLPAATLPSADVIVNPNQPGCSFESKSLAGVGVMFYVAQARPVHSRDSTQTGRTLAFGGVGHCGRCGQVGQQQPTLGGTRFETHSRRRHALWHVGLVQGSRP
jgi:single-stranded-DNA-specific exonuclease